MDTVFEDDENELERESYSEQEPEKVEFQQLSLDQL